MVKVLYSFGRPEMVEDTRIVVTATDIPTVFLHCLSRALLKEGEYM